MLIFHTVTAVLALLAGFPIFFSEKGVGVAFLRGSAGGAAVHLAGSLVVEHAVYRRHDPHLLEAFVF